jgi:protein gp37
MLGTAIEWTDATWNPWQGCTKVSPGCEHCYMYRDLARYGKDPTVVRRSSPQTFDLPLKKNRHGEWAIPDGSKVFICSWSDFFHEAADGWREDAWDIIRERRGLTFQIVTKRVERVADHLPDDWRTGWDHVWLLATAENQAMADVRASQLSQVPAQIRGLSIEPLLGHIDLRFGDSEGVPTALEPFRERQWLIHWVICGGESGPKARPMHPEWARSIRNQCRAAGVPFFFKQWGEWVPSTPKDERYIDGNAIGGYWSAAGKWVDWNQLGESPFMVRVGKKSAGRSLDGLTWSQFPSLGVSG